MPEKSIPRYPPLDTQRRRACETVDTLARCLGELAYLQDGLAQVRALLGKVNQTVSMAESVTTGARDRAILWLLYRHRPIFAEAEAELSIRLPYWANTLGAALDGSWDDAMRYLDAAVGAHYLHAEHVARPRWGCSSDEESFNALVQACRAADMKETWIIERMRPGADPREYADKVYRIALADAQARVADAQGLHGAPGKRPAKGGRPKGQSNRPKDKGEDSPEDGADERYRRRVVLCNLWRENPTRYRERAELWRGRPIVTWTEFVREVDKSGQLASQRTSQKSIIDATKDALNWGAPAPGIPLDPVQFVLG